MAKKKFLILILSLLASVSRADEAENGELKGLKIAGDYVVIEQRELYTGGFYLKFKSKLPSSRFDFLELRTDHIHSSIQLGSTIRLSAEVISEQEKIAKISQVAVFISTSVGSTPIWLLSNQEPPVELNAISLLRMHAPQNDYSIM